MDRPECHRCRSYRVTWDTERPHGCRAFGFESRALPSRVVEQSSGRPCELFEEKPPRPAPGPRP